MALGHMKERIRLFFQGQMESDEWQEFLSTFVAYTITGTLFLVALGVANHLGQQ